MLPLLCHPFERVLLQRIISFRQRHGLLARHVKCCHSNPVHHIHGVSCAEVWHTAVLQAFKPFLDPFIDALFNSLTCGQQTTAAAAGEFVGQVRDLLGPNIWAGRLTEEQRSAQASSPHVPPPTGVFLFQRLLLPRTAVPADRNSI